MDHWFWTGNSLSWVCLRYMVLILDYKSFGGFGGFGGFSRSFQ